MFVFVREVGYLIWRDEKSVPRTDLSEWRDPQEDGFIRETAPALHLPCAVAAIRGALYGMAPYAPPGKNRE